MFALSIRFISLVILSSFLIGCGSSEPEAEPPAEEPTSSLDLTVSFSQAPDAVTTDHFVKMAYTAQDAAEYQCRLDDADFSSCEPTYFNLDVGIGFHEFAVKAISEDGGEGDAAVYSWEVESLLNNEHEDLIATNTAPDLVADNSWRGIIRINCDFAHSSYNDPIVFLGQENAAHLHRFYGNTEVDHTTTESSLYAQGESSCQGNRLNLSSYWVPALLAPLYDPQTGARVLDNNGEPAWQVVRAVVGNDDEAHEIFYYSAGVDDLNSIQPVPAGLRMIAGDHSTQPGSTQDTSIVRWHCQEWGSDDSANPLFSATIPECKAPDRVRMDIFFPSCWDGVNLDSTDHKSHMAYPVNDGGPNGTYCPETHPVPVARPSYHYAFGVKPDVYDPETQTSRGWRLAADKYEVTDQVAGGLSLHGDWFNGWHPQVMQMMVDGCIKQGFDCHDGNLVNGFRLSGTRPGTQIEPEIINGGMGQ